MRSTHAEERATADDRPDRSAGRLDRRHPGAAQRDLRPGPLLQARARRKRWRRWASRRSSATTPRETSPACPDDFDYVFHAAADVFPVDIETGLKQNAEGTGLLLNHLNRAKAWIYVSTSGVYWDEPDPWYAYKETDRCGGSTRINTRFAYGTSKFAGEAVARSLSRIHDVPLTIARMNWSYGRASFGGAPVRVITRVAEGQPVPVNPDWEMVGCPIHEDDMAEHLEPFFKGAAVGGTVTNWGGDDAISVEQYVPWVAGQLGTSYSFTDMTDIIAYPRNLDPAKRISLTGPCKVKWQDGFRRDHRGALPRAAGAGSRAAEHRAAGGGVR